MPAPRFDLTREVRLGVVMYGGSSLAIYINGVAQELLNLVRATAPDPANPTLARVADERLRSTEGVYRQLARLLADDADDAGADASPADEAAGGPIRIRFVVDLISGSSAGGINGVFLAKALANDQPLTQLTRLWVEEGDFANLVNDRRSVQGFTGTAKRQLRRRPPPSLLNGHRMYYRLLEAFEGMEPKEPAAPAAPLVDDIDLYVTATDVNGFDVPLKLGDKVVREKRYRAVWHLSRSDQRTDFGRSCNALLAFAARSTSAFPFAFEPVSLDDVRPIAALFGAEVDDDALSQLFLDYRQTGDAAYEQRPFGDGGSLDNKPFSWIVDALASRRSTVPVDRRLLYVEPDPGDASTGAAPIRPDPVANAVTQALLPRKETIREDLERIRVRNETAARVLDMVAGLDKEMRLRQIPLPTREASRWVAEPAPTLAHASTLRLKVRQVAARLAALATRAVGQPARSDYEVAVQAVITAWVDRNNDQADHKQFLLDYDLGYRLRRINFVQRRTDELRRLDPDAVRLLFQAVPGASPADGAWAVEFRAELGRAKATLNGVYLDLCRRQESLGEQLGPDLADVFTEERLVRVLQRLKTGVADVSEDAWAVAQERSKELGDANSRASAMTRPCFEEASRVVLAVLEAAPEVAAHDPVAVARCGLRYFYERYEHYDNAVLPIISRFDGELDPVEVFRISPRDATDIGRHDLAGMALGHFGAFADAAWRRNDIMWGRLDAVDRLVTILLGRTHPARRGLLDEAQRTIVREELVDTAGLRRRLAEQGLARTASDLERLVEVATRAEVDQVLGRLRASPDPLPAEGNVQTKLSTVGRATTVVSDVLKGAVEAGGAKRTTAVVSFGGRVLTGLAEAAIPRSLTSVLSRYWLQLLMLAALVLIVLGGVLGGDGGGAARSVGWKALGLAVGFRLLVSAVSAFQPRRFLRLLIAGGVLVVLGCGFAAGRAWGEDWDRQIDRVCDVDVVGKFPFWCDN